MDHGRKLILHKESPLIEEAHGYDPYKGIDAKILTKQLLKTLSVGDRQFVFAKFWEGLSNEQLAERYKRDYKWTDNNWQRIQKLLKIV